MQMEAIDCLITLLLVVFVLATAIVSACSVLENGIKYTVKKLLFWCITGVLLSILAVAAITWIGKVHGENMKSIPMQALARATGQLAICFSCLFFLEDNSQKEREKR